VPYARLAEFPVELPPLRRRREDILLLLAHALGDRPADLTPSLAEALVLHGWPYNVRELRALAQELRIRGAGAARLGLELVEKRLARPGASQPDAPAPPDDDARDDAGDAAPIPDRAQLEALLRAHRGVVADVARAVRRSRKQVYRWITEQGLDVEQYRKG
jgi:DNA-binding NtrC family response regulator